MQEGYMKKVGLLSVNVNLCPGMPAANNKFKSLQTPTSKVVTYSKELEA